MATTALFCLTVFGLLLGSLGLTSDRLALRKEYARLLSNARTLLLEHSVRSWPEELAKWEFRAKFAPWFLLRRLARITKKRLGGMGSLGDVVIYRDGRSDEEANKRLLEFVGSLYSITTRIAGQ
jgi:hypothetical protein